MDIYLTASQFGKYPGLATSTSVNNCYIFFLLYKHTDDGVFDDFPKISDHFPKSSEDFSNCPEDQTNVSEHFPRIFEDVRRLPKIAEHFRGRPEDVSMIHQRI